MTQIALPKSPADTDDELTIAVMLGDGIGPEVLGAALEILSRAAENHGVSLAFVELPAGLSAIATHGSTLPKTTIERLSDCSGWILGPVSHHTYPARDSRFINPSGYLRKHFDLFANVRPISSRFSLNPSQNHLDLVLVRENTEGFYPDRNVLDGNGELRPDGDTVMSVRVITRRACTRIAQHAVELALTRRRRVTIVHKANVLRQGDGLFLAECLKVSKCHPEVAVDDIHIDAFATRLVLDPSEFDVIVTTNMFGDILSGVAAGLVGGLGFAPSLNCGVDRAMAQAAHGSAPDLAGKGIANPVAAILSVQMLAAWLAQKHGRRNLSQAAVDVEVAVALALLEQRNDTHAATGVTATSDMTAAILDQLRVRGRADQHVQPE